MPWVLCYCAHSGRFVLGLTISVSRGHEGRVFKISNFLLRIGSGINSPHLHRVVHFLCKASKHPPPDCCTLNASHLGYESMCSTHWHRVCKGPLQIDLVLAWDTQKVFMAKIGFELNFEWWVGFWNKEIIGKHPTKRCGDRNISGGVFGSHEVMGNFKRLY